MRFIFFACGYTIVSAPFVEKIIVSPLIAFFSSLISIVHICVGPAFPDLSIDLCIYLYKAEYLTRLPVLQSHLVHLALPQHRGWGLTHLPQEGMKNRAGIFQKEFLPTWIFLSFSEGRLASWAKDHECLRLGLSSRAKGASKTRGSCRWVWWFPYMKEVTESPWITPGTKWSRPFTQVFHILKLFCTNPCPL